MINIQQVSPILYNSHALYGNSVNDLGISEKPWKNIHTINLKNRLGLNIIQGNDTATDNTYRDNLNIVSIQNINNQSIFLSSTNGGITLNAKTGIYMESDAIKSICTNKIETINNEYAINSNKYLVVSNSYNIKSVGGITLDSGNNRLRFLSSCTNPQTVEINIPKGGFYLNSGFSGVNVTSGGDINLVTTSSNANVYLSHFGTNKQTIHVGNNLTDTVIYNKLVIKGKLVLADDAVTERYVSVRREVNNILELSTNNETTLHFDFGIYGKYQNGNAGLFFRHSNGTFHLARKMGEYKSSYFNDPEVYGDLCLRTIQSFQKIQTPLTDTQCVITSMIQSPQSQLMIKSPNVVFQNAIKATNLLCQSVSVGESVTISDEGYIKTETMDCDVLNASNVSGNHMNMMMGVLQKELVVGDRFSLKRSHMNYIGEFHNLQKVMDALEQCHQQLVLLLTDSYMGNEEIIITQHPSITMRGLGGYIKNCNFVIDNVMNDQELVFCIEDISLFNCNFYFKGDNKITCRFVGCRGKDIQYQIENTNLDLNITHCDFTSSNIQKPMIEMYKHSSKVSVKWSSISVPKFLYVDTVSTEENEHVTPITISFSEVEWGGEEDNDKYISSEYSILKKR